MQLEVQIHQLASSATASTRRRPQTREEEIANSHSHGLGLAAALVAGGFLIAAVVQRGSLSFSVGVGIYAATMVLLYLGSTLYHGLPVGRAKAVLLVCDHSAIGDASSRIQMLRPCVPRMRSFVRGWTMMSS